MKKYILIILITFTYNCSQFLTNEDGPLTFLPEMNVLDNSIPPEIVYSYPVAEQPLVDPDTSILIIFSEEMNQPFTESAFSLKNSGETIDGSFTWVAKSMYFKPFSRLDSTGVYSYTVSRTTAESKTGVNPLKDYSIRFTYNPDTIEPTLTSSTPANGASAVDINTSITLVFSKPMNTSLVMSSITISPSADFNIPATVVSNNDTTFEFILLKPLSYGTSYVVTVPNSLEDKSGNKLLQNYSIAFTVGNDFIAPTLTSISTTSVANFVGSEFTVQEGFEKDEAINLTFSEAISYSTVINGINTNPSFDFTVTDTSGGAGTSFSLTPTSNLDIAQTYQIQVTSNIKDIQNNALAKTYTYNIKINGPRSQYIQVLGIYTDNTYSTTLSTSSINIVSPSDGGVGPNYNFATGVKGFYIYFCRGETVATCDTTSNPRDLQVSLVALQASISYDFGPSTGSAYMSLPTDVSTIPGDIFIYKTTLFSMAPSPTTYKFTITGGKSGVQDQYSNYMQNDYTIRFQLTP